MKFGNLFAGSALIKRTLALCIALVLLGSLFVSAYAAELTEEIQPPEEEPAAAVLTCVFLVNGAQYRCVTVGSGETLTRPDDPVLDGHSFAGWFTADGMEFTGFGTVAEVEASATVELYGRFAAAEVPAVSEEPPAPQSPVIGEDNEEEPEDKQPAEEPKPEDGGDEVGIENENEEEESAEAPQSLSAAAGQYGFTAQGALPERAAELSVIGLEDGQESLRAAVGSLLGEDIGESYTVYAFDITLIDEDGNSLQPTDGMVSISVSGLELGDIVRVVHVHGAAGAPMRLRAAAVSAAEELSAQADGGVLTFSTGSFSTFYVLSGKTELSPEDWYHTALVDMDQGTSGGKTIYAAPGTVIRFERNYNRSLRWNFSDTPGDGFSGYTVSGGEKHYFPQTTNGNRKHYAYVEISSDAQAGATAVVQCGSGNNSRAVTIIVKTQNDIIREAAEKGSDYPVYIAVIKDSRTLPGEPTVISGAYYFHNGRTWASGGTYSTNPKALINIEAFIAAATASINDTNTAGVADASGAQTKAVLIGIDYERLLARLVDKNYRDCYAADGTPIKSGFNAAGYEIIPYVVKLQTSSQDKGWHIDFYVKAKEQITLSYDANLPDGKKPENINVPNTVTGGKPLTATVGTAMVGTNGIAVGTTVNCTDGTVLRFTGWNTNADGTGTGYGPGDVITVNENTVLYGQWEESAATVRIEKLVAGALGDWDREFGFTYKIGDAATAEFTLKHNDEYTIENVPLGSTVTVTEEDCSQSGYTTSYQIDGADKQNGRTAEFTVSENGNAVVFTNFKDVNPDTGVALDSLPYVLILLAAAAGSAVFLIRRCRKNRED